MKTQTKPVKTSVKKENAKEQEAKEPKTLKVEKSTTEVNEILNPTAEQRIKKMKNFQLLAEKHAFLKEKAENLESFILSSDGTKEKITLSNAKGFHFEVTNTQVTEDVLKVLSDRLKAFTEASEKEILEYNI